MWKIIFGFREAYQKSQRPTGKALQAQSKPSFQMIWHALEPHVFIWKLRPKPLDHLRKNVKFKLKIDINLQTNDRMS